MNHSSRSHGAMEVLICGAGAAGLTLAIDLARRGVPFRIIEKRTAAFPGSRGKGIQPRSQEIFEDIGVLDRLVAMGGPYPPARRHRADGGFEDADIAERITPTPAEPYQLALMVPQFLTERVLRERLAELGAAVAFGCELVGFRQDDEGVVAHLSTPGGDEQLRVRFLVGADGGRSFVRQELGIGFPGKTLGMRAVVADVVADGVDPVFVHMWHAGDMSRQMALFPLAGTDLVQVQAPVPADGEIDVSATGLTRMIQGSTGSPDIVVRSVAWSSVYGMNARLADHYRVGRAVLAGDAAHVHPPSGGQGLNTSIQDAYNLGWKLAAVLDGAPEALLDTYEAERRPIAAEVLGLSTGLLHAMTRGEMKRGREVSQLDLGYRHSALSLDTAARTGGLRAGDRAPDAPLQGAAGQPLRLFHLLAGPHWTAFGFNASRDAAPSPRRNLRVHHVGAHAELRDTGGHFADAYGLSAGDCVLIRPDGYVAAIIGAGESAAWAGYLPGVGLGATADANGAIRGRGAGTA